MDGFPCWHREIFSQYDAQHVCTGVHDAVYKCHTNVKQCREVLHAGVASHVNFVNEPLRFLVKFSLPTPANLLQRARLGND